MYWKKVTEYHWRLVPENKYLPRQQTLRIEADASYTLTEKRDGQVRRGRMDVQRGQMTLFEESGEIGTMWYENVEGGRMQITDLEGTKYEARRR